MGYWIYMQAFLDVALVAALGALWVGRRRRLPVAAWQREVGGLVDTLSALVVEVDRVTARARGTASTDAAAAPADRPDTAPEEMERVLAAEVFGAPEETGNEPAPGPARVPEIAFVPDPATGPDPEAAFPGPSAASLFPPPAPERKVPRAPAAKAPNLADEVLACAREGLEPDAIARRVGRPVGEVTLVLGLNRAHAGAAAV